MHITTRHPTENRKRHGEHLLISLTYIGKNIELKTGIELTRALEQWRRYFEESGLVAALVINDGYFVQNIQGSRPAVNSALAKIIDEHFKIIPNVVKVEEIESLRWDGFVTKHLTSSAEDEEYALKSFSADSDFNPYLMKSAQIENFLTAIFEDSESSKF
ncbi:MULTISPECIES: BLUF domain-containing protein [unclassified Psychrobacter]|uniref:BLUF domain-containing protein n=1 Tax=unclassified Psychrobacter TaxID=196806 RepID=UPI0025B5BF10|nr:MULTISPECIES: BLUF domain-containing protein [unclassified Psychrobacter]MDN3454665.1 BLUF domain-containing protein [Psychrobacter sp. APC 3350]MDN3503904.1 BLUF domain-containing protein [Psychrobacter sp. 5A.1]